MRAVIALIVACTLAVSGCGSDSPTTATPAPLNLVGTWTGTWTFMAAGATVTDAVTMTLAAAGTSVSGQWSSSSGASGTVVLTQTADVSGTATIGQTLLTGVNCSASTTLTGTASATQIRFTFAALAPTGLCQWGTNQQFTYGR